MSLFGSLLTTGANIKAFERGLSVAQNNVGNVATPGYARQRLMLSARRFDPLNGLNGGVLASGLASSRNLFREQDVRRQQEWVGQLESKLSALSSLEGQFDVSGEAGIGGAMTQLWQAFEALSIRPNDPAARELVLSQASALAGRFGDTMDAIDRVAANIEAEVQSTAGRINYLAQKIAELNSARNAGGANDAGIDAAMHASLEELSKLADISVLADGATYTVLLGGQTALVTGVTAHPIRAELYQPSGPSALYPGAPPSLRILDAAGADITGHVRRGELAGLVEVRNQVIPTLRGDAFQQGELNRLAQAVADRVNGILTAAETSGDPPQPGIPLFVYDAANPAAVARTLARNPAITPDLLAVAEPGPPPVANGALLRLAGLANSTDPADRIDGVSFGAFLGNLIAGIGRQTAEARSDLSLRREMLGQAETLRDEMSGVSLDEEALYMMQFQRAYQAAAQMVRVLDELTQTTINMLR
jgi:flagellar hook-associated protein 1